MTTTKQTVGGGVKKILYAMQTINQIGIKKASKALNSKNTCKACGLGMGGQLGGMTDEQGAFPSVCNKSVQAQSTDIQPAIPDQIFDFSLDEFRKLSPKELEHLGRLGKPIYKSATDDTFSIVDWGWALKYTATKFRATQPDNSFFYASGRSSNEAGFLLQLFARLYGSNHVNNCSYYCHQATGVGLANTIGTGTATVELEDLDQCDFIFLIGANPASNHPRFIYKLKQCRERGGQVVVINPAKEPGLVKFAVPKSPKSLLKGGSEIASEYLQPNIGSDWYLLMGLCKAVIEFGTNNSDFIDKYTTGSDAFFDQVQTLDWQTIENQTALSKIRIIEIAKLYGKANKAVFAWGMGITHHNNGVENIEAIANLAMLRGMIGQVGAGLLPLRGHSNVQGIGTVGVKPVLAEDVFEKMQTELGVTFPAAQTGMDTLACLEAAHAGKMNSALIMGGNLYQATPNSSWANQALDQISFKCFLTTTLNYGHIHACDNSEVLILPVTARDEEPQATTQESMFNFLRLSDGGIKRIADARSEVSILANLASKIINENKFDFSEFESHQNIRQAIAKIVPGMEQLQDIEVAKKEFYIQNRLLHEPKFNTVTGKANFISSIKTENRNNDEYPFLMASIRSEGQFNSIIYEEHDSYRSVKHRWSVLMNKQDIQALNKNAGDIITLKSPHGEMKDLSIVEFDIPKGNLLTYYPEANCLIGLNRDPRSQTPAFKSVPVKIV